MGREELCELTNMCMVYSGDKILVQDRKDPGWPGIVFPGGHVEPEESFVESVVREMKEETGLTVSNLRLCGVKQFPSGDPERRYLVLLFKTDTYSGELRSSDEGRVFWIDRKDVDKYTWCSGMETTVELFFRDDLNENYFFLENDEWQVRNL